MKRVFGFIIICLFFHSCVKDVENPYNNSDLDPPNNNDTNYFVDPTSFAALQNNVFQPYCANSGCHDGGMFPPDFRTIESSYSTLVYQPVIKNNLSESYSYRVKAGDSEKSVLYARLLSDINGVSTFDENSQVMPLTADIVYDPNQINEWHAVKNQHISNIKAWIDGGAKDIFGNIPLEPNKIPEMRGCVAFQTGQNALLSRELPRGTIYIPSSINSVDFWFSVQDDLLSSHQLTYNKVKFSKSLFGFDQQSFLPLEVVSNPENQTGFYQSTTDDFFHKYTLDMSTYESGDVVFIKIYLQDDVNPITEIPSNGSDYQIIKHFSFTIL